MRRVLRTLMATATLAAFLCSTSIAAGAPGTLHPLFSAPPGFACSGGFNGGNGNITGPAPRVTGVRVGHHGVYDRFVIQVSGTVMPSYRVTHHSTTFPLGTGSVKLKGTHGLLVRLFPVNSTSYKGPKRFLPGFPILREARMVEYFEGVMRWGLGIGGTPCLRVAVFTSPTRLVVDVAKP